MAKVSLEADCNGRPLTTVDAAARHTSGPGVGDGLVSGARDVTWRTDLFGPGANARRGNLNRKRGDACRGGGLQETTGVGVGRAKRGSSSCVSWAPALNPCEGSTLKVGYRAASHLSARSSDSGRGQGERSLLSLLRLIHVSKTREVYLRVQSRRSIFLLSRVFQSDRFKAKFSDFLWRSNCLSSTIFSK